MKVSRMEETNQASSGTSTYRALLCSFGKESVGSVTIKHLQPKERKKRMIKAAICCLGAAAITLFIPVAHFILVPSLLLSAPIVAWIAYRPTALLLSGEGKCPMCEAPMRLTQGKGASVLFETCAACHRPVEVHVEGKF
jgi:hypothetical protein